MPLDPALIPIIGALILSIIIHEVAHGFMANWLGDPTARLAGRLTLNPLAHIDLFGSILLPGILVLMQAPLMIGYAKPVPYNPYNLKNQKWGDALVAFAGPGVNLLLAVVFALIVRTGVALGWSPAFVELSLYIVSINLVLAFFNLIPIPPADGSKVIGPFLPYRMEMNFRAWGDRMGMFGIFFLFAFVMLFGKPFFGFVSSVGSLLTGLPL